MIKIDQKAYENIINDLVNTKEIKALLSIYSRDKIYYYSILCDIADINSRNSKIVKQSILSYRLSENYIREQANSLASYLYPKPLEDDYYQILNVSSDSSKEEIRKSWTKLMKDFHPDLIGDEGLESSRKINEAYSVLKDEKKREIYDSKRVPILKVVVSSNDSILFSWFNKAVAFCLFLILLFSIYYFLSSGKKERTELADYQSTDLSDNDGKRAEPTQNVINENSRILKQIEDIQPKISQNQEIKNNLDTNKIEKNISQNIKSNAELDLSIVVDVQEKSVDSIKITEEATEKIEENKKAASTVPQKNKSKDLIVKNSKISNKLETPVNENIVESTPEKNEIKTSAVNEDLQRKPDSSSLFKFISQYITAYKERDINKISSLFYSDALENGVPISKAINSYIQNFSDNNILKYDVKINKTSINDHTGYVDSDFNIIFKKYTSDHIKSSTGKITWHLEWKENDWKIKNIDYSILDTKRIDEFL